MILPPLSVRLRHFYGRGITFQPQYTALYRTRKWITPSISGKEINRNVFKALYLERNSVIARVYQVRDIVSLTLSLCSLSSGSASLSLCTLHPLSHSRPQRVGDLEYALLQTALLPTARKHYAAPQSWAIFQKTTLYTVQIYGHLCRNNHSKHWWVITFCCSADHGEKFMSAALKSISQEWYTALSLSLGHTSNYL